MQRRGRSRKVSRAALARQASEERAQRALMEKLKTAEAPAPSPVDASSQFSLQPQIVVAVPDIALSTGNKLVSPDSNIIDLTRPDSRQEPNGDSVTPTLNIYPPSVPPSSLTSAASTPDASESHPSDSYFSSTPPSLTLLDELHMAYALDDLPLAKILLLKITHDQDITSRTDPRLDSVKPEDFDVAFLPRGGLMTPEDEVRLAERQEKERKRLGKEAEEVRRHRDKVERERREREKRDRIDREEKERVERERAWEGWVEDVWGNAKREMEQMKDMKASAKKRQDDAKRQEEERRRVIAERRRSHVSASKASPAPRISYAHLPTARLDSSSPLSISSPATPELLYALPNIPRLSMQRKRVAPPSEALRTHSSNTSVPSHPFSLRKPTMSPVSSSLNTVDSEEAGRHPTSVSLQEVLTAMRGELFPSEIPPVVYESRNGRQHVSHIRAKSDDLEHGNMRQRSQTPNPLSQSVSLSTSASVATRKRKREAALLADLLAHASDPIETDRLQNRRAGKAEEGARIQRRDPLRMNSSTSMSKSMCTACSASLASPSASSSSSAVSSSGSWLSFTSSSASSTSTVLTTPSASFSGTSPPIKSSVRTGGVFSGWLKSVSSHSSLPKVEQCTCDLLDVPRDLSTPRGTGCRLIPVAKIDSPLPFDSLDAALSSESSVEHDYPAGVHSDITSMSSGRPATSLAAPNVFVRSMSHFIDVAKTFQSAYMNAAMFAAVASVPNVSSFGNEWDREFEIKKEKKQMKAVHYTGGKLQPVGYRAGTHEVALFKSWDQQSSDTDAGEEVTAPNGFRQAITHPELFPCDDSALHIPLVSAYRLGRPPRTVLPNPLPFSIHFKPQSTLTASPPRRWLIEQLQSRRRLVSPPRYGPNGLRRSRRSPSPSSTLIQQPPISRPRFVGNPVYLRLKALQNCTGIPVTDTPIIELREEGVSIKSGILSCGKEKVLGTAFEEVGRSRLGVDVFHIRAVRHRVSLPVDSPIPWWKHRDDIQEMQLRWEDGSVRRGRSVVKG